jgi:predicted TIM-barrel fold metal-dependent hydrolase
MSDAAAIPVVDAHHHLWDLRLGRYPWLQGPPTPYPLGDYSDLRRDYLIENYLADIAGCNVRRSVHVQADWDESDDPTAETRWLQSIADRHGFPHAIVAYADLMAPEIADILDRQARHANLRGIRMLRPRHPVAGHMVEDKAWRHGFAMLGPRNLLFELRVPPRHMHVAAALARDFPTTSIVIDHLALPIDNAEAAQQWRQGIAALATCANAAMKISGFAIQHRSWSLAEIRPWVMEAIAAFGPDRCLFGSNYPVDRLGAPYKIIVEAMHALLAPLGPGAHRAVMHDTACRLYRL